MPIKYIVATLAAITILSMTVLDSAQGVTSSERVISTTADFNLFRAKYRIITTGSTVTTAVSSTTPTDKDKDAFRVVVKGIVLQDGDCLSWSFVGDPNAVAPNIPASGTVDIGSPTFTGTNACLTLARRRARGPIGVAPYDYEKAKAKYNPRRNRLVLMALRGRAQSNLFSSLLGSNRGDSVPNVAINVVVHVRRPSDTDTDFTFTGSFIVRHNVNRRKQVHIYRGKHRL